MTMKKRVATRVLCLTEVKPTHVMCCEILHLTDVKPTREDFYWGVVLRPKSDQPMLLHLTDVKPTREQASPIVNRPSLRGLIRFTRVGKSEFVTRCRVRYSTEDTYV